MQKRETNPEAHLDEASTERGMVFCQTELTGYTGLVGGREIRNHR